MNLLTAKRMLGELRTMRNNAELRREMSAADAIRAEAMATVHEEYRDELVAVIARLDAAEVSEGVEPVVELPF